MKIYIVSVGWNCEGSTIMGVYEGSVIMGVHDNQKDADLQRQALIAQTRGDYVEVQEWELGQTKEDPCNKGGKEV